MEEIFGLIVLFGGLWAVGFVMRLLGNTVSSAARAAHGKGSFKENMEVAYKGPPPFQVKLVDTRLGENEDGPEAKQIEAKGLIPIFRTARIGFVTSVFDNTSGNLEPVYSHIDEFQESETVAYQHLVDTGEAEPGSGFLSWVKLGVVIPAILQTPFSGKRNMVVFFRMVDLNNLPQIFLGFKSREESGILWQETLTFDWTFSDKGYEEAAKERDEANALTVKMGIAVAMADGSLDDSEGEVIKQWVKRIVDSYKNEEKQKHLKGIYNTAMKEAYQLALDGKLILSNLTSRMNEIADNSSKYETIELCQDVMAADGVADKEELKLINQIAKALDLDLDEVKSIQDQKIIHLDKGVSDQVDIEALLGIDNSWDQATIKKHLLTEFNKWNSRLNTLDQGEERNNAQQMIDWISEARKKYA